MDAHPLALLLGAARTSTGAAFLAAPKWSGKMLLGKDGDSEGAVVLSRALGARDVALGGGVLATTLDGDRRHAARLLQLTAACDAVDAAALFAARARRDGAHRWTAPLAALACAAAGAAVSAMVMRDQGLHTDRAPGTGAGLTPGEDVASVEGIVDQQGAVLEQMEDEVDLTDRANGRPRERTVPTG